jgi:hypothetical protein
MIHQTSTDALKLLQFIDNEIAVTEYAANCDPATAAALTEALNKYHALKKEILAAVTLAESLRE